MVLLNIYFYVASLILLAKDITGIYWERVRCSIDHDQSTPEGILPDIGRFPWLGVVQHSFYVGGTTRFAITGGILIHPAYAIAAADDIARILPEALTNNTRFVLWQKNSLKFSLEVRDYTLHPEYGKVTLATIALLELYTAGETGIGDLGSPVLPVCLPVKGGGSFSDLFAVRMNDDSADLQKEMLKMDFVESTDCEEYYHKAQLSYEKMTPRDSFCVLSTRNSTPCVWDAGGAVIAKQSWAHWTLIGFGLRGPGCGAPARFINVHSYLSWIDEIISNKPLEEPEEMHRFLYRRLSPFKLEMFKADAVSKKDQGQCGKEDKGNVLFKDAAEINTNINFAQGFFYVIVTQVAEFLCASVTLEVASRTNAAVWLEHHCAKENEGHLGSPLDERKMECFVYYKTSAYVEFRFHFSFKAIIEVTLYGNEEPERQVPNPFHTDETTDSWWPTGTFRWQYWVPKEASWYWM